MSWSISPALKTLAGTKGAIPGASILGLPIDGGYFAGYISLTADGNPTHALIVAPRPSGATGTDYTLTTDLAWKTSITSTSGTDSAFDGLANTLAMVTAGINDHPAAKFCTELALGGFTDWYLPAQLELDIVYFNLKPSTQSNATARGINAYSVPIRTVNYTTGNPSQTGVNLFKSGGLEAFVANTHWSSTQTSAGNAWYGFFSNGALTNNTKTNTHRVRAFRRIAL